MRIFVAGATGVLGRRLVRDLTARGHEVTGLARSDENVRVISAFGGIPRRADLFDPDSLAQAAKGCEVLIHAATHIPPKVRTRLPDWAENDKIRRAGTRALSQAAGRVGAKLYLQQSVVWVAEPADESPFDETAPLAPSLYTASAAEAEGIARDAGDRLGFNVAILRCGAFYSADSSQTRRMAEAVLRRRLPTIGAGTALWANLHSDDASSAFVTATEVGRGGLWHVVDDTPAPVSEFVRELARDLGAPEPGHVPAWLAGLFMGRGTLSLFARSTRTSNARIRRDLRWSPEYPSYREGLRQIVDAWKGAGSPRS